MNILGISCYYHDAAAALLRDGQLIAAAEEERFTRVKHDFSFPKSAIQFCLDTAGIRGSDVDYVAFFEKPFRKFDRILMTVLQTYPLSYKAFRESMIAWMIDKLWVGATISAELGIPKDRVLFCEHHLARAASAFLCSHLDEAAILTWMASENGLRAPGAGAAATASICANKWSFPIPWDFYTAHSLHSWASKSTRESTRSWGWRPTASPAMWTRFGSSFGKIPTDPSRWTWTIFASTTRRTAPSVGVLWTCSENRALPRCCFSRPSRVSHPTLALPPPTMTNSAS